MARRSGLGKGLGALIPTEVVADRTSALLDVPLGSIVPNPRQPRTQFDEELMASLAASIRELGVLQPILVRAVPDVAGQYELVAGERRWRAAKRAGLQTIPAMVKTVDNASSLEQALVENLHRQDLNALEEAAAYQQLIEDFGLTHDEVATRVGKSRAAVTNVAAVVSAPPVDPTAAHRWPAQRRPLPGAPWDAGPGLPGGAGQACGDGGLSVRMVEEAVRLRNGLETGAGAQPDEHSSANGRSSGAGGTSAGRAGGAMRPAGLHELEEMLADHLDTRVKIDLGAKKGRLTVEFAALDDLERIYSLVDDRRVRLEQYESTLDLTLSIASRLTLRLVYTGLNSVACPQLS